MAGHEKSHAALLDVYLSVESLNLLTVNFSAAFLNVFISPQTRRKYLWTSQGTSKEENSCSEPHRWSYPWSCHGLPWEQVGDEMKAHWLFLTCYHRLCWYYLLLTSSACASVVPCTTSSMSGTSTRCLSCFGAGESRSWPTSSGKRKPKYGVKQSWGLNLVAL